MERDLKRCTRDSEDNKNETPGKEFHEILSSGFGLCELFADASRPPGLDNRQYRARLFDLHIPENTDGKIEIHRVQELRRIVSSHGAIRAYEMINALLVRRIYLFQSIPEAILNLLQSGNPLFDVRTQFNQAIFFLANLNSPLGHRPPLGL